MPDIPGIGIQCGDCGAHFQLDPSGSVQGAACSECGGKRFFRTQPSPVHSDGDLRNMVDPVSQVDQGGNPLGEGTIVGEDGERPAGKRDNYMHSKVASVYDQIAEMARGLPAYEQNQLRNILLTEGPNAAIRYLQTQNRSAPSVPNAGAQVWEGMNDPLGYAYGSFSGNTVSKQVEMRTLNMEPYAPLWDESYLPKQERSAGFVAPLVEGAGALLGGEGFSAALPSLMKGALLGGGMQMGKNMISQPNQGSGEQAGGMAPQGPDPAPGISQLGSNLSMLLVSDLETPHSVKSVDEQHDDPEKQDQKEFNDGDKSPSNLKNPNNQDSGASGEDGVRNSTPGYGFGPNSPGVERAMMILPLILHYFESEESGESDPLIRGLHEALEAESPGYLDNEHPDGQNLVQQILQQHKSPRGVHAGVNAFPSGLPAMPGVAQDTPNQNTAQGTCRTCGAPLAADGSCPNCGANQQANPMGAQQGGQGMVTPGGSLPPNAFTGKTAVAPRPFEPWPEYPGNKQGLGMEEGEGVMECPRCHGIGCQDCNNQGKIYVPNYRENGSSFEQPRLQNAYRRENFPQEYYEGFPQYKGDQEYKQFPSNLGPMHQGKLGTSGAGPQTDEQKDAVRRLLEQQGRMAEVPLVDTEPWRFNKELNQIQQNPNIAPLVDPNQPSPAPQPAMQNPQGAMPVMDPSQMGGGGGQPMMPMSKRADLLPRTPQQWHNWSPNDDPDSGTGVHGTCPYCHSPTTMGACTRCGYVVGDDDPGTGTYDTQGPHTVNMNRNDALGEPRWGRTAADSIAPRCPQCGSHTTTLNQSSGDDGMSATCNACGKTWDDFADQLDMNKYKGAGRQRKYEQVKEALIKEAPGKEHMKGVSPKRNRQYEHIKEQLLEDGASEEHAKEEAARTVNKTRRKKHELKGESKVALVDVPNPALPNAAERTDIHPERGQDVSGFWHDSKGQPIMEGQTYELYTPGISEPDHVQVVSKSSERLNLKLVGEAQGIHTNPNEPDISVTPQQMVLRNYSFVPATDVPQQNAQPSGGMPGLEQIPQSGQTTDEVSNSYPNGGGTSLSHVASEPDLEEVCHTCGGDWVDHTASSPETTMHECARCGSVWETRDEYEGREAQVDLSWLNEGPGNQSFYEEMERAQKMRAIGGQSRSIATAVAKDERYQRIHDLLEHNARTAGKHFTPSEQRALINERGSARNADLLDLTNTHYETLSGYDPRDPRGRANGLNVPDAHLTLGL